VHKWQDNIANGLIKNEASFFVNTRIDRCLLLIEITTLIAVLMNNILYLGLASGFNQKFKDSQNDNKEYDQDVFNIMAAKL
jgi:hypothetical protein